MLRKLTILAWIIGFVMLFMVPVSATNGSIHVETQENVALYLVGTPEGTGYRLITICGGGYITFDDTLSPELAYWLSGRMQKEESLEAFGSENVFYDLQEGLYLVCCEEAEGFPPFLVTIPWDGYYWEVDVDPTGGAVPQTGDPLGCAILAMSASGAGLMVISRRRKNY